MPRGTYIIKVDVFSDGGYDSIPATVTVKAGGCIRVFETVLGRRTLSTHGLVCARHPMIPFQLVPEIGMQGLGQTNSRTDYSMATH